MFLLQANSAFARVDKVAAGAALNTVAHHNSGIEHVTRKVEGCGPAPMDAELEQNRLTVRGTVPWM